MRKRESTCVGCGPSGTMAVTEGQLPPLQAYIAVGDDQTSQISTFLPWTPTPPDKFFVSKRGGVPLSFFVDYPFNFAWQHSNIRTTRMVNLTQS